MPTRPMRPVLPTVEGTPSLVSACNEEEYSKGIVGLKSYKAAGIDDVLVEQQINLGPRACKQCSANVSQRIRSQGFDTIKDNRYIEAPA